MNYAEDYVQEAYLKLCKYDDIAERIVGTNGKVSKGYMFFALRSVIINDIKKRSNLNYDHVGDQYDFEEKFMHVDEGIDPEFLAKNKLEERAYEILKEKVHWFDYELFKTYIESGKSFTTIAEESKLGVQTIYLSIKKSKLIIAENLFEDYQDFLNGDFDLL